MYKAIVTVNRSDMPHNRGELFYAVMGVDKSTGRFVAIFDHGVMPFVWGFKQLDHAMQVADAYNDYHEDALCPADLARRFSEIERADTSKGVAA